MHLDVQCIIWLIIGLIAKMIKEKTIHHIFLFKVFFADSWECFTEKNNYNIEVAGVVYQCITAVFKLQ